MISECYRTIRTSLLLSQSEKPPQLILLTSPSPGEGKTVTSLNLAIALAQDGHTVLLVDGDMRKGLCHSRLGLRNNRGLSNVLTGGLSLEEGIQQTPISGLSLLSRGVLPPNPSELLGSRKMKEVLKELRQTFDFILIDSPPVMAISDAAILSVVVDGVLLVLHGQKTSTAYAQKAVERLDMVRARLLGVILNGVNLANPHYSFYRSYATYYELPNGNGSANPPDGAYPRESDDNVDRLSKILDVEARKDSNNNGAQKTEGDRSRREMTSSDPVTGSGDIDRAAKFEPRSAIATDSLDKPVMTRTKPASPVSRQFINRLIDAFMESVGPMAPLIVRDRIALLGESQDAFPKSRVDELVKLIAPEIFHSELRIRFQKRISEELSSLDLD
jgi:capsular exopolysaccharide synthesis family protein